MALRPAFNPGCDGFDPRSRLLREALDGMTTDRLITVQTAMQGVAVAILLAGLPWAYSMHGRVTSIESNATTSAERVREMAIDVKEMNRNAARIDVLEQRINALERKP